MAASTSLGRSTWESSGSLEMPRRLGSSLSAWKNEPISRLPLPNRLSSLSISLPSLRSSL